MTDSQKRLAQQFEFIVETDKLKGVLRRTRPIGLDRMENSAEHSWQIILMALTLAEHSNAEVDLLRVVKMLAIHDCVEIDVGDTFHYAKSADADLYDKELAAARRVFGMLPEDQANEFLSLWEEFEAKETPEAKFATAVDRVVAFLMNRGNDFGTWTDHSITPDLIRERNSHVADGSVGVWEYALGIVAEYEFNITKPNLG